MPVADCDQSLARRMAIIAAISQNLTTGVLFGSFGTMLFALEDRFHADRAQSSITISLAVVTLSLTAAWLGTKISRVPLRSFMICGAGISALGFGLLTVATSYYQLWAVYLLLLGPGAGLSGVLASNSLAASWTRPDKLGSVLGWVNAPILVTLMPLLSEWVLSKAGLVALMATLAILQACAIPLLFLVREHPSTQILDRPRQSRLRLPLGLFVMVVIIVGVISGGGLLKLSHMLPLVTQQGYSFSQANSLLSISGLTGILGSLLLGLLSDRVGPSKALAANALLQAASWLILLVPSAFGLLIVDAIIVGICGGGLQAIVGALIAKLFGEASFGRVYGLLSLATLPFLFGLPWLAGYLYVRTGTYHVPISLQIAAFVLAGIGALLLRDRDAGPAAEL